MCRTKSSLGEKISQETLRLRKPSYFFQHGSITCNRIGRKNIQRITLSSTFQFQDCASGLQSGSEEGFQESLAGSLGRLRLLDVLLGLLGLQTLLLDCTSEHFSKRLSVSECDDSRISWRRRVLA